MPTGISDHSRTGSVEIRTTLQPTPRAKTVGALGTSFDSLIIEVSGADIGNLRYSKIFDPARLVSADTLTKIPAGSDRRIKIYTVDRTGSMIQADTNASRSVRIDPNVTTSLSVVLLPTCGSIYLQLENIPTRVDSVIATFTADDSRTWVARARRSTRINLTLDKIPNALRGTLNVVAIDTLKDTIYRADKDLTFNARSMETVALSFTTTPGRLSFDMTVVLPGVTAASGNMAGSDTAQYESGELLITEIMYAANDSEYVEVYNPKTADQFFDSLYIEIDGTQRLFTNITIAAGQAFVLGRKLLPWCDASHTTASALDLSSTGNWITIRTKNQQIIDRVIVVGGANLLEWPVVSGKQSIVLDPTVNDPASNNFGRNWHAATATIPGSASQSGTPRVR